MYTTQRLVYRPYRNSDLNNLLALLNTPEVGQYITEDYYVPKGSKYMDKMLEILDAALLFFVIENKDGEFVGFSGIIAMPNPKNRNATFSIAILPAFWNKGFGTEIGEFVIDYAFRQLGMHRVSLTVFEGNDRARAAYRKIGFVEEGVHRKIVWIDGEWRDTYFMGILEEEWKDLKRKKAVAGAGP